MYARLSRKMPLGDPTKLITFCWNHDPRLLPAKDRPRFYYYFGSYVAVSTVACFLEYQSIGVLYSISLYPLLKANMSESSKTCPLSISLPQRWRPDGAFPVTERKDDGSFPGNINEYTRQDDVLSLLQHWKSDGSFPVNDWSDDGSFTGSIKEFRRQDDVIRKRNSSAAGLWKIGSLQRQRLPRLHSKKARSSQPLRWRMLCCSTRVRSESNMSRDDGTTNLFDDETPLLDWSALSRGQWREDWWSCED
jgi:hypothetical protein